MQTLKIIIGVIFAISAISVTITMAEKEQGAGLFGAMTGCLIFIAISIWLIYSGIKGNNKN